MFVSTNWSSRSCHQRELELSRSSLSDSLVKVQKTPRSVDILDAQQSIPTMAYRLEKFEKLFGGSKRKDRAARRAQTASNARVQAQSKPMFPSPSFIRPTSIHMTPREEERKTRYNEDLCRSFSLHRPDDRYSRRSSCCSSKTVTGEQQQRTQPKVQLQQRPSSSDCPKCAPLQEQKTTPQLAEFKFPEDSLFKNDESRRNPENKGSEPTTSISQAHSSEVTESPVHKPVRGSPKHISLLLNRQSMDRSDNGERKVEDSAESILLPSPVIVSSSLSSILGTSPVSVLDSEPPSPERPLKRNMKSLPLLPRLGEFSTLHIPHTESPPASESGDDCQLNGSGRCPSPASLPTPTTLSARESLRESFDISLFSFDSISSRRHSVRETWSSRPDSSLRESGIFQSDLSRPRWLQRPASMCLSPGTSKVSRGNVLREPTLDDFLALSDDDIAEDDVQPSPVANSTATVAAPSPLPKDTPKPSSPCRCESVSHRDVKIRPRSTIIQSSESSTLASPRDSVTLVGSSSPNPQEPIQGSALIATIAATFGFDQVYIISFWPDTSNRNRRTPDEALLLSCSTPKLAIHDADIIQRVPLITDHKSRVTGRLLAAHGLRERVTALELPSDILVQALGADDWWFEYNDNPTNPDGLSHGFLCSFYGSRLGGSSKQSSATDVEAEDEDEEPAFNRGIVFAAFNKKNSKSIIPNADSPYKEGLLDDLLSQAKLLVDETIKSL